MNRSNDSGGTASVKRVPGRPHETLAGLLWTSPWLVGFLAFLLLPIGMSLYYSFTEYPLLEPPVWVGLENYARMLRDDVLRQALLKTLVYAAVLIPLATAFALAIAGLLNTRVRAGGFFQAAVFLPTLVPMAASAMVWLWVFNAQDGPINRALGLVGIKGPNWLTGVMSLGGGAGASKGIEVPWAFVSLIIIALWGVGQAVLVYLAALREVPRSLYEAAALDGMGPLRRFFSITLPMISPVILFNVITLMIGTLQVFVIPYVLTKATPGGDPRSMYFLTSYMYDSGFVYGQMGYASALAWLQLVLTLILTAATFAVSKKLVHYRAG